MTRKVAICGCGSPSTWLPAGGRYGLTRWETWRLAWDPIGIASRFFEIHARRLWMNENPVGTDIKLYEELLANLDGAVVFEANESIDRALRGTFVPYPIEQVTAIPYVGEYFCSSIAYMMAMAYLEKVDVLAINVQGFPRAAWQEAVYERPNIAYLAGLFRGAGMEIAFVYDDWHEMRMLDEIRTIDLTNERMKRWHLEYLYGKGLGAGHIRPETTARREDLLTVPWKDPPRYGYQLLEETGVTPHSVLTSWARETGVVL